MDLFDDLGRKITDTAEQIGKKTEDVVEKQRVRTQLHTAQKSLEKAYAELGKQFYQTYEQGETVAEEYWPACEEVQSKETAVKQLRQQYAQMQGEKECACCHAANPEDAMFCSKCGSRIEA